MKKNTVIKSIVLTIGVIGIIAMIFAIGQKFQKPTITDSPITVTESEKKEEVIVEVPEIKADELTISKSEESIKEEIGGESTEDIVVEETTPETIPQTKDKTEKEEFPKVEVEPVEPEQPNDIDQTPPAPQPPKEPPKEDEVYVPGFGYIKKGGPNKCEIAEDMYENGNKIGVMG